MNKAITRGQCRIKDSVSKKEFMLSYLCTECKLREPRVTHERVLECSRIKEYVLPYRQICNPED